MDKKNRRALNVSLQSKRYNDKINEIIYEWEQENKNISTEVCEALLLNKKLEQYSTLSNIFKIVSLLGNLAEIYNYTDETIDELLNEIILVDNEKFSDILIHLKDLNFDEKVSEKIKEKKLESTPIIPKIKTPIKKTKEKSLEKIEKKEEEIIEKTMEENNLELEEDIALEIPLDFLLNS